MLDMFNYQHLASHLNTEHIYLQRQKVALSMIVYTFFKKVQYTKVMAAVVHFSYDPFTREIVLKKMEYKLLAVIRKATHIM